MAHVGLSEAEAREKNKDVEISVWPMSNVDRALTDGDTRGFIKLTYKKDGTLLGVTIVSNAAGELIHEWVLAMDHGMKVTDPASSIHVYPTYSMANMQMAADIRISQLLAKAQGRLLRRAK